MKILIIALLFVLPLHAFSQNSTIQNDTIATTTIDTNKQLISAEDLREQGKIDAKRYYHRAGGAMAGTFATALVAGGLLGLIPAFKCSSVIPADKRLDYPDSSLMKKMDYRIGYINQAHNMKKGRVWASYGFGVLGAVVITLIVKFSL